MRVHTKLAPMVRKRRDVARCLADVCVCVRERDVGVSNPFLPPSTSPIVTILHHAPADNEPEHPPKACMQEILEVSAIGNRASNKKDYRGTNCTVMSFPSFEAATDNSHARAPAPSGTIQGTHPESPLLSPPSPRGLQPAMQTARSPTAAIVPRTPRNIMLGRRTASVAATNLQKSSL